MKSDFYHLLHRSEHPETWRTDASRHWKVNVLQTSLIRDIDVPMNAFYQRLDAEVVNNVTCTDVPFRQEHVLQYEGYCYERSVFVRQTVGGSGVWQTDCWGLRCMTDILLGTLVYWRLTRRELMCVQTKNTTKDHTKARDETKRLIDCRWHLLPVATTTTR